MKNMQTLISNKLVYGPIWIALAAGLPISLTSSTWADSAAASLPTCVSSPLLSCSTKLTASNKSIKLTASSKKRHDHVGSLPTILANSQSTVAANPAPTVVPGVDLLPRVQGQQAVAAAKDGEQDLADGSLEQAEEEFRLATKLDATNGDALSGLAQTLEREGKSTEAISVYRYLLYPKPGWGTSLEEDPILRMHFALLLVSQGQWAEPVSVYEDTARDVSLGSSFPKLDVHFNSGTLQPALLQAMAHLVMGITYSNRLEHSQALAEYASAVKVQPNLALANYYYGHGLLRLGRSLEAETAFSKAGGLGQGEGKQGNVK